MMLTDTQRKTIAALINVFETGTTPGDPGCVRSLAGETPRFCYGRTMMTIESGHLGEIVKEYVTNPYADGFYRTRLAQYLPDLIRRDHALNRDLTLRGILLAAGAKDRVMQQTQDRVFDHLYVQPALSAAASCGLHSPLSVAAVYEGHVSGSWWRSARQAIETIGRPGSCDENSWTKRYIASRRSWLSCSSDPVLRAATHRTDTFIGLIRQGNWSLSLPIAVGDLTITADMLDGVAPVAERTGWELTYKFTALEGRTWENPNDGGRNYYPLRSLLNVHFSPRVVAGFLTPAKSDGGFVTWQDREIPCPMVARGDGQTWVQVQAFATWMGLSLKRDRIARRISLVRQK